MKNNSLYALGLTAAVALYGCNKQDQKREAQPEANKQDQKREVQPETNKQDQKREAQPETKPLLEVGEYYGMVEGKPAEYRVTDFGYCYLKLRTNKSNYFNLRIKDRGCDNTADEVDLKYDRKHLEAAGRAEKFDSLLREGRKLATPENKVKRDYQKELDDLLRP